MAFKNIFGSAYAVVENIQYNGPRKTLTFDLVQYRSSSMEVESARSTYRLNGNLSTQEIDSVITDVPSGLDHEALPDDFDFDPNQHRFKWLSSNVNYTPTYANALTIVNTAANITPITNPSPNTYQATASTVSLPFS